MMLLLMLLLILLLLLLLLLMLLALERPFIVIVRAARGGPRPGRGGRGTVVIGKVAPG
jgi:hypothetical protein